MKKILTGILGIILVISVVSASAYAVFSSQATLTGLTVASGNANITIGDGTGPNGVKTLPLNSATLPKLYPGIVFTLPVNIHFHNESTADIDLKVKGQITAWSAPGAWNELADNVLVDVKNVTDNSGYVTYTLRQWHDAPRALPGNPLPYGDWAHNNKAYEIRLRVPSNVGNEMANQVLNNIKMTVTGEQVL